MNPEVLASKLNISEYKVYEDEFIFSCPFHLDEHPSLAINLNSGKYQCFAGCVKGNSISELIYKITGKNELIDMDDNSWVDNLKAKLFPKLDYTKLPFIPILPLAINNSGEIYLKNRGFTLESIKEWQLMYWESINAIVIPINGIGFIIRYIDAETTKQKYKYVSGTKITNCLFGLEKLGIYQPYIILVEGALDCIWLHQLGFRNSLGLLHSDISDIQYKILLGVTNCIFLLMDSDEGGEKAAQRISKVLRKDFLIKICQLPKGNDPNNSTKEEIDNTIKEGRSI